MASSVTADATGVAALRGGVALVAPVEADWLDVLGADRVRFLHNLTTCEKENKLHGIRDFPAHGFRLTGMSGSQVQTPIGS